MATKIISYLNWIKHQKCFFSKKYYELNSFPDFCNQTKQNKISYLSENDTTHVIPCCSRHHEWFNKLPETIKKEFLQESKNYLAKYINETT